MFWFIYDTMDFPADCPVPIVLYYPNTVGASGWGQRALWPLWRCEVLLEVKGQRQNCHTWMCAHLWADRQQLTAPHAADRPSPWSRLGSPGGITKSAGMHLWQVTQFTEVFSPFTRTHLRRCRIWERSIFNLSPWGLVVLWLFLLERQSFYVKKKKLWMSTIEEVTSTWFKRHLSQKTSLLPMFHILNAHSIQGYTKKTFKSYTMPKGVVKARATLISCARF